MRNHKQNSLDTDRQTPALEGIPTKQHGRHKKPFVAPKLEHHDELIGITGDRHFDWGGTVPMS